MPGLQTQAGVFSTTAALRSAAHSGPSRSSSLSIGCHVAGGSPSSIAHRSRNTEHSPRALLWGVPVSWDRRMAGGARARRVRHGPGTEMGQNVARSVGRKSCIECNLVQKVSAKELDDLLKERPLPLVIDFYATWCGPCVILAQQLEQLAVEYHGDVQFVKVDTDEEYQLANQLEIRGLPTLVFVSKDKEKLAKRTEGVLPLEALKELIEEL